MTIREYLKTLLQGVKTYIDEKIVKSDWNINDETNPAYIQNRPFYEGQIKEEISTITWDGNPTEDFFLYNDFYYAYMVSEITPSLNEYNYLKAAITYSNGTVNAFGAFNTIERDDNGDLIYVYNDYMCIIYQYEKCSSSPVANVPKNGIYLINLSDFGDKHITSIELDTPYVSIVAEVHTLDPKFLPDNIESLETTSKDLVGAINEIVNSGVSVGDTLPIESQVYFDGTEDEIPEGYIKVDAPFSNPNLLINGDFQVAQRGTEFASQNKWFYTVDRWKATNCRVIRAQNTDDDSHYVSVVNTTTQNRYFMQAFEGRLKEDVYTISLEATIYSGTVKVKFEGDTNDGEFLTLQNGINVLTRTVAPTGVTFELGSEADFTLQWVKMEKGSIATPFVPRLYAEELVLCQRYFYLYAPANYTTLDNIYNVSSINYAIINIPITLNMRTTPSVSWINGDVRRVYNGATNYDTPIDIAVDVINNQTCKIKVTYSNAMPTNTYITLFAYNSFKFTFDAEIY